MKTSLRPHKIWVFNGIAKQTKTQTHACDATREMECCCQIFFVNQKVSLSMKGKERKEEEEIINILTESMWRIKHNEKFLSFSSRVRQVAYVSFAYKRENFLCFSFPSKKKREKKKKRQRKT